MSAKEPSPFQVVVQPWVSLAARLILGGALLAAGLLKITDLTQSVVAVQAYQLPIPAYMESIIGYGQPIVEILVGAIIIAGLATRWSGLLGGLAMLVFIGGIISVWARGLSIDCGCFTPGGLLDDAEATKYAWDIVRDSGFLACAVWLVVFPASRFALGGWINSPTEQEA